MSYTAVVSREIGDTTKGFEWAAVDADGNIVEEVWDGGLGDTFIANKIRILEPNKWGNLTPTTMVDKISMNVYITDSRVIMRCDKYDRGDSSWYGGLSALAMNAIERGIGAVRSRGKTLIGHVRYEWLKAVYYSVKTGWLSDNIIRLCYFDNEQKENIVELTFRKDADPAAMANRIFHKAIAYRCAMTDEKEDDSVKFFNDYSNNDLPVSNDSKEMSGIEFPISVLAPMGSEYRPLTTANSPVNVLSGAPEKPVVPEISEKPVVPEPPVVSEPPEKPVVQETPVVSVPEEEKTVLINQPRKAVVTFTRIKTGEDICVDKQTVVLGRSAKKADYIVDNPTVSSAHARIYITDEGCFIEDLDSTNHTYINGVSIQPNIRLKLQTGDVIKLSNEEFKVDIG